MVESQPSKLLVASSILVSRSISSLSIPGHQVLHSPAMNSEAVSYGFVDDVSASLEQVVEKLAATLGQVAVNLTSVEVRTCLGGELRAFTRANIGGGATVCVPEKSGRIDAALWKNHCEMLDRAVANRVEMLQLAAAALSGLAGISRPM